MQLMFQDLSFGEDKHCWPKKLVLLQLPYTELEWELCVSFVLCCHLEDISFSPRLGTVLLKNNASCQSLSLFSLYTGSPWAIWTQRSAWPRWLQWYHWESWRFWIRWVSWPTWAACTSQLKYGVLQSLSQDLLFMPLLEK